MPSASTQCLPAEIICSICKDTFTDPATIRCGHRFCTPCLCLLWEDAPTVTCCPVCKAVSPKMDLKSTILAKKHIRSTGNSVICQLPGSAKQMCRTHQVIKLYFCEADKSLLCLFCARSTGHAAHKHYSIMQVAEHYRCYKLVILQEHLLMQMKSIWKKKQENQRNIKKVTNTFRAWEGVEDTMKRSQLMQLYIPQPLDPQLSTWTITGMLERLNSFRDLSFGVDPNDQEQKHGVAHCKTSELTHLLNLESDEAEDSAEVSELLGPFKCPQNLEMAMPKSQDDWSKEDIVQLLESMEKNIPSNERYTFKATQSVMDWGKVAFKDFSGEMCKLKWLEISYNLRKFRTLKELVLEAKENVNNFKSKIHKKHPDLPKKPLTAYLRFFKEMRPQYLQKHPKMSNKELTKVLSEEYRKLPEQLRLKYSQDFQKEKQEFQEKMALFREQHPDLVQNSKKPGVPKRSQSKVPKKFQENVQKVKSPPENHLPMKSKFHGEPEKPPMNAYHKFHQDLWSSRELKVVPPRERMVEISRRWQRVPQDQKELYKKQAEELQTQYRVDLDLWLRTLSPEEYAAYREATCAKPQLCTLPGLACVSANVMDSAEVQFTTALRLTNDWELWAFIVTNLRRGGGGGPELVTVILLHTHKEKVVPVGLVQYAGVLPYPGILTDAYSPVPRAVHAHLPVLFAGDGALGSPSSKILPCSTTRRRMGTVVFILQTSCVIEQPDALTAYFITERKSDCGEMREYASQN
ncbi:hypothetical protein MJG53_016607 [Ovis ammon polii x Ovis aries]|uniref:Uncharacterized protein n=1 Tax=Ovis ammon polii x Ovis aries TaxID=2918886 RepID=A0ACB9U8X7_9CETA|nr:hypothetical protein MJG53_016607 [Ovis ammon polii x Ovis aries]